MALQLQLLQELPLLTHIYDNDWRDKNVATLHIWHAFFADYADEAIGLLRAYHDMMVRYRQDIHDDNAEYLAAHYDDWYNHIELEIEDWFIYYIARINSYVWYGKIFD